MQVQVGQSEQRATLHTEILEFLVTFDYVSCRVDAHQETGPCWLWQLRSSGAQAGDDAMLKVMGERGKDLQQGGDPKELAKGPSAHRRLRRGPCFIPR